MAYEYKEYDDIPYAQVHCDRRICHAPGECAYCDEEPMIQLARFANQVAFTGHTPLPGWRPCPADAQRGDSHEGWGGNQPVGGNLPLSEKERLRAKQRPSSLAFYGDVQASPEEQEQYWRDVYATIDSNVLPEGSILPKLTPWLKLKIWATQKLRGKR